MKTKPEQKSDTGARGRRGEKGAALVTSLLISFLLLAAGGALIMSTAMTASNAYDGTAESQAYYAAEAGLQSALNVLRGQVAPSPLFASNPMGGVADENKISFRKAVTLSYSNLSTDTSTTPRLSQWLPYSTAYPTRVPVTSNYTPLGGMAFGIDLSDPDTTATVKFSASAVFDNNTTSKSFGNGQTKATLTYTPQAATTITSSGNSTLGYITLSNVGTLGYNFGDDSGDRNNFTNVSSDEPTVSKLFRLTITQTAPYAVTLSFDCKIVGRVLLNTSDVQVMCPTVLNSLAGVTYERTANPALTNGSGKPITVKVSAPEPSRLVVKSTGYGPRNSKKIMQAILSRFAFDYAAPSGITIRSSDTSTSVMTFDVGNSFPYVYSGYDNAGSIGNLSAFGVTGQQDYDYINRLNLNSNKVTGSPSGVVKVDMASLPDWLLTADSCRRFVAQMRQTAMDDNRYFTTDPASYGTTTSPLFTFVDGDASLPPQGGAGLLIVTGKLTVLGTAAYKGLILVLGTGNFDRSGGGIGSTLGGVVVARFDSASDFLAPTFNSSGSGSGTIQYDSEWVRRALAAAGPKVVAVGEF